MTLAELRAAVQDLGVPDLADDTVDRLVNLAQQQVFNSRLWNSRLTDRSVPTGQETIETLGKVVSVWYVSDGATIAIPQVDRRDLELQGLDLTQTGDFPSCWYFDKGAGYSISTYPVAAFVVRSYEKAGTMSSDGSDSVGGYFDDAIIYQAGGHAFAQVGILDMSQYYFNLAKDVLDALDHTDNDNFITTLPVRYSNPE